MNFVKHCPPIEVLEQRIHLSITPTITGTLPAAVLIAGQKTSSIHQVVHLKNTGAGAVSGKTTITLQLSPEAVEDANAVNAGSVTPDIKPEAGENRVGIGQHSFVAERAERGLFVIAKVSDPAGVDTFATSQGTISVVPATIDLVAVTVVPPANAKPGKKGNSRVTITNMGNSAAVGNLAIDLQASSTSAIDSTSIDLGLTAKHVSIRPNKKITVAAPATFPSTGGPFFIIANVNADHAFVETTLGNNVVASAAAILGQTETTHISKGALTVKLSRVANVPGADGTPQDIVTAPGVAGTQFITTRNGDILTLANGALSGTPFLSMAAAGVTLYTGGEGGLLDLAFSPTFSTPNTFGFEKFYTFDTEAFTTDGAAADFSSPELFPTTNVAPNNKIVIREWTVSSPTSATANLTSRVLLTIDHPQSNHQGGALRFGPDGDLYIGLGDGGGANDENGSANDPADGHTDSTGNAQDPGVVFGKILRINPDPSAAGGFISSANHQYSIPASNPFADGGGLGEIYAMGLRNPYRMSFDSGTGKLYVGNVGQDNIESVDIITGGGNYGWPFFEGSRNNQANTGRSAPSGFTFTTPIAEYTHSDGTAVIGGEVDRNAATAALNGQYIFGDLASPSSGGAVGRLFYTPAAGGSIAEFNYDASGVVPSSNLYGFGTDNSGGIDAFFANGDILAISVAG